MLEGWMKTPGLMRTKGLKKTLATKRDLLETWLAKLPPTINAKNVKDHWSGGPGGLKESDEEAQGHPVLREPISFRIEIRPR